MSLPQPHDAFFRALLADPAPAGAWLRAVLPPALVERIDWAGLALLPASFVDEELSTREADLLFHASIAGREARVYLLFEHQSTADPRMPFRLLRYLVRIWERELAKAPPGARLPVIIPVVVYAGERAWTTPRTLRDCLDADPALLDALGPLVPDLSFVLDDLLAIDEEVLRERTTNAVTNLGALVMRLVRNTHDGPAIEAAFLRQEELARQVALAPNGVSILALMLRYLLEVTEIGVEALVRVSRRLGPAVEDVMKTGADVLRDEGREQGRAEGEVHGRAETLLLQLRLKFGVVPDDVAERVRSADRTSLDRWTGAVLFASTLDEAMR